MKTVKLTNRDLDLTGGKATLLTEQACCAQRLKNSIALDKGSWVLGPEGGIEWIEMMQQKTVSERLIRASVQSVLEKDSEVTGIAYVTINFTREERKLQIDFEVSTIYGTITESTEEFI